MSLDVVSAFGLFDALTAYFRDHEHVLPEHLSRGAAARITVRDLVLYTVDPGRVVVPDARLAEMSVGQLSKAMGHEIAFHVLHLDDMAEHDARAEALLNELVLQPLWHFVGEVGFVEGVGLAVDVEIGNGVLAGPAGGIARGGGVVRSASFAGAAARLGPGPSAGRSDHRLKPGWARQHAKEAVARGTPPTSAPPHLLRRRRGTSGPRKMLPIVSTSSAVRRRPMHRSGG